MYGSNNFYIFSACPPCKLKLFTWVEIDHMIDLLYVGPEYNTKLKVVTEERDVAKWKERAAKERGRASKAVQKLDEGASTSTGSGAKPKDPRKAGSGAHGIGEGIFFICLIVLNVPEILVSD